MIRRGGCRYIAVTISLRTTRAGVIPISRPRTVTAPVRPRMSPQYEICYVVPADTIRLRTNDSRLTALADRLWERAGSAPSSTNPIELAIEVVQDAAGAAWDAGAEHWVVEADRADLTLGNVLEAKIDCARACAGARLATSLLEAEPSLAARLVLETPVGAILARRGYGVVHAGAVVGSRGAVVVRGAPGAGKSTLVAAAHQAGFGVLADEAILVDRRDPDELLAGVRDVMLLPDAARMLGLEAQVAPAAGREPAK